MARTNKNLLFEKKFDTNALESKLNLLDTEGIIHKLVPFDKIIPNPENKYPMDDREIELTALTIELLGETMYPLTLKKLKNGQYKIIDGGKRYNSYQLLRKWHHEDPVLHPNPWNEIKCFIESYNYSSSNRERLKMHIANLTQRQMNNRDKRRMVLDFVQSLEIEGNENPHNKDIAHKLKNSIHMTKRQIDKYKKISRDLILPVLEMVDSGNVFVNIGDKLSSYPDIYQLMFLYEITLNHYNKKEMNDLNKMEEIIRLKIDTDTMKEFCEAQLSIYENKRNELDSIMDGLKKGEEVDSKMESMISIEHEEVLRYIEKLHSSIHHFSQINNQNVELPRVESRKIKPKTLDKRFHSLSKDIDTFISGTDDKTDITAALEVIDMATKKLELQKEQLLKSLQDS